MKKRSTNIENTRKLKSELRKEYLGKRKDFHQFYLQKKNVFDEHICCRLRSFLNSLTYQSIMLYYPYQGEVSLLELLSELLPTKMVLFPRVVSVRSTGGYNCMEAVEIKSGNEFIPGYKEIKEPVGETYLKLIDIILVPGVSFSVTPQENQNSKEVRRNKLFRIGYGGGFYDNFLKRQLSATKIGVFYELQKCFENFSESHDVSLDMIITEKKNYNDTSTN